MTRRRIVDQPFVGLVASAIGAALLLVSWSAALSRLTSYSWLEVGLPALAIVAGQYLGYLFPVHIRYTLKIEMTSVPLYLAAVLLPVPIAGTVAGAGMAFTELAGRSTRGSTAADIATQVGRWVTVVLAGSVVAHLVHPALSAPYLALLPVVALILLAGDLITVPFQLSAINGEPLVQLFKECLQGVGAAEGFQYFFGIMGAVLALTDVWNVVLVLVPIILVHRMAKRAMELRESTRIVLEVLADQVDGKDPFTHEHSKRVTNWTREILREMEVTGPEAQYILTAARLHDIGKISIPEEILNKHEELTPQERERIEQHAAAGADMVAQYPAFARGAEIIRHHHERVDGQGYPDRMSGTCIPFGSRVIAVADAFDAMTRDRPYRDGMGIERALALLRGGRGTQWDASVVDAFSRVIPNAAAEPVVRQPTVPLTSAGNVR